jgi:hypothetical protein
MNKAGIDPSALAAQRRGRIHALRTRVAVGAVSAFVAIWCVLFVQLATGHDPGLNDASTVAVVQSADPEAETSSQTSDASRPPPRRPTPAPSRRAGHERAPATGGALV